MAGRIRLHAGMAAVAGALLLAVGSGAAAAERQLALDFQVWVGGFRTVDMAFETSLTPDAYRMKLKLDARGVIDWFFAWSMVAASEGRLDGGRVVPVKASTASVWAGRDRRITIEFPRDAAPVATVHPEEREADRDPVPDAMRRGTRDLAGAIMASLHAVGETGRCDHEEAVFDGRRRYDLVLAHLGNERLAPSDYSAFSGEALKCRLSIRRVAGFRKQRSRFRWARSDTATVWIARVFPDTRPVPVRIEHETLFGDLRGHLVKATLTGDGGTKSLRRPD